MLSPLPLADRARLYLEKMPSSVAGSGGHQQTFAVAVALVHGFGLSEAEAWPILSDYNVRCLPPWSEAELRHKLATAGQLTRHPRPKGYLAGCRPPRLAPAPRPTEPKIIGHIALPPEVLVNVGDTHLADTSRGGTKFAPATISISAFFQGAGSDSTHRWPTFSTSLFPPKSSASPAMNCRHR